MAESKGTVLVSGATGYIGAWVVREFLDNGYRVRGTVRSLSSKKGKEHLDKWIEAGEALDLVEASLDDEQSWTKACEGCDYVAHVASPFFVGCPDSEAEVKLFQPARNGTLFVLKAAQKAGTVKRVVLTSSVAAIEGGHPEVKELKNPEEQWTDIEKTDENYMKSKTMAELAAWDFVKSCENEGKPVFELVAINPTLVVGPPLSNGWATSHEVPKRLINREMPMLPNLGFGVVDVRDVAKAHRLAIEVPEAAGNRFVVFKSTMSLPDWARILRSEFHKYGYNVPTITAPYALLWLASFFDGQLRAVFPRLGKTVTFLDNSKSREVLGLQYIDEKQSLIEHVHGCLEVGVDGFVKSKKYKKNHK